MPSAAVHNLNLECPQSYCLRIVFSLLSFCKIYVLYCRLFQTTPTFPCHNPPFVSNACTDDWILSTLSLHCLMAVNNCVILFNLTTVVDDMRPACPNRGGLMALAALCNWARYSVLNSCKSLDVALAVVAIFSEAFWERFNVSFNLSVLN